MVLITVLELLKMVIKYVREQEERDKIIDQYSLVERPVSSFTSSRK